ncbi:MAG TPA: carbohydrate kinase [Candidatus Merdivicinus intestinavium]|nr:carbohydrate kinase [Candidatus Merdivicinus intestinavium]
MTKKQYDIAVLGELLIDFTPVGVSEKGNPIFERNPGGGPANMACAAARMGAKPYFIGKVGDDPFGRALKKTLEDQGVDAGGLLLDREAPTTLAFVHLDETGERSFSFYRRGGADTLLRPEEADAGILDRSRFFFCSSVMMAEGPSRETSFFLMREARRRGTPVVFDPNLRPNLWADGEEMRRIVRQALPLADFLKVSEEEAQFLAGEAETEAAAAALQKEFRPRLLLVTLGAEGVLAFAGKHPLRVPGFRVNAVDTTAAGDSFTGGFLAALLASGREPEDLAPEELRAVLRTANAVGALTASRKGSISALPDKEETGRFLAEREG